MSQQPQHIWIEQLALEKLTPREKEVLILIAEGLSNKEMAVELGLMLKTIDSHRANLMAKLQVRKTANLVRYAIRVGLIEA